MNQTQTLAQENNENNNDRHIALWLLVCAALIFAMVILGGVTRLTRSGLSIVHWQPVAGIIPPMSKTQWQQEFDHYRETPEYKKINKGMDVEEFKSIFWFEYSHRLLGRIIGIVFLLPFLYFLFRKKIRLKLIPKLVVMFILGGLQGLLGWYMVKSGLVDQPQVSQYRLTAHLLAALAIYGFILWVALGLLKPKANSGMLHKHEALYKTGLVFTALVVLMITSGGFVAGTKAGFAFNTFPLMNGKLIPDGLFSMQPLILNIFENIATIQFNHRLLAYVLAGFFIYLFLKSKKYKLDKNTRISINLLFVMLVIQITLGITTLLFVMPTALAASHQAGALLLFTFSIIMNHNLRRQHITRETVQ